jgi:hypothetical protein
MLTVGWVLGAVSAGVLKGIGKFKLRAAWLAPLVDPDALGSQPGGLSDPAGTRRGAFGSARSVVEVVADGLGPSLRWATATTTRATRSPSQ